MIDGKVRGKMEYLKWRQATRLICIKRGPVGEVAALKAINRRIKTRGGGKSPLVLFEW